MKLSRWLYLLVCFVLASCALGWHSPLHNALYHCWDTAHDDRLETEGIDRILPNCSGLGLQWDLPPPDSIHLGHKFNVSYRITYMKNFFKENFNSSYFSYLRFSDASQFEDFCMKRECGDANTATKETCCVYHSNVHSCNEQVEFCGPWIPNDGKLATHTDTLVGTINRTWHSQTRILFSGTNNVIAHVKIGGLHIAVNKEVYVYVDDDDDVTAKVVPSVFAVLVVVCIIAVAVVLGGVYGWYQYQRRKLLYDESWIIDYDQIERDLGYRGFMGSMVSMKWMESDAGGLSSGDGYISNVQRKQLFTQTGMFQGRVVAIKKIPRKSFSITKEVREEVRQMREIYHPNLCKFIGATVKVPNIAIITEYGPKGSLNDVLQNDDIPLNWGFRFSFATDIARGISHLHRHHLSHGMLKSSNCIIDDRWVVKITDYGLSNLRDLPNTHTDAVMEYNSAAQIYLSPERRANPTSRAAPPSDIYSFGIILVEIGTRFDPYSDDLDLDGSGRPRLPNFKEHDCPCSVDYQELICRCWSQFPIGRPTIDHVKRSLQSMNPNKESPVDMMMTMMEKYSKHLEVLVAERTQDLIAEQKKTDALLHSMLPKEVAGHLRQGKAATAQSFQCATIFFSDIIGFTSLAGSSTPLQIVKLLNELYTTFDTITDTYDVYKVETIGDAYMVVSGVPRENGLLHASEIANMAIDMISSSQKFKIPHRTEETLQIRCGIHSGPVVAGVVGMKMPRYCLFGDTVNTASRMESTSEAMKVQASDSTAQLLKKIGGFQLECRGSIQVKGKGTMLTWWLLGRENSATSPIRKASIPSQSISRPGTASSTKSILKSKPTRMGTKMSLPGAVEE